MNLNQNKNLLAALDLYARQQDELLPDDETLSGITLSPDFCAKMERLLTRRKRGFYVLFGTVGRRVASILIALLVTATAVTVSVKAWREAVLDFFSEVFEKYTQVTFEDKTPRANEPVKVVFIARTPTYIPKGYVVEREETNLDLYRVTYTNPAVQHSIRYTQRHRESGDLRVDTEGVQYEEIAIGDYRGITYSNKETTTVVFSDDSYTYTLSGYCTLEELIQIAKSIQ